MNRHDFLVLYFCVVNFSQSILNTRSRVNLCGKNVFVNFLGGKLFLRIAGKIAKIRTRKNFVPDGISSLSELFLFCRQLVSIFEENNKKKIVPFVGEKLQCI